MRDHYAGGYYAKIVISRCAWFNDRRDLRVGARPRRAELFIEERRGGWGRENIVIVILVRQEDWLNYILELYAIVGERNKWKREISLQSSSRIEVLQVQESKILNRENSFGEWRKLCNIEYPFRFIWISESVAEIRGFKRLRMEDRDLHFFLESCSLRPSKNLAATFFQESRSAACL